MNMLSHTLQGLADYLDESYPLPIKELVSGVKKIIEEHGELPPDIRLRLAHNGTACAMETVEGPYSSVMLFVWDYNSERLMYINEKLHIPNINQKPLGEVLDKAIELVYLGQIEETIQNLRSERLLEHYDYIEETFEIPWSVLHQGEWTTLGEILSDEALYEVIKYIMDNEEDIPYRTYKTLWFLYKEVFKAVEANNKAEGG